MTALARSHPRADGLVRRVLDQAARELLLLQSRDDQGFAAHLTRFGRLAAMAESGVLDEARVALWERRSPVFPQLDYRVFSLGGSAPEPRELATAE